MNTDLKEFIKGMGALTEVWSLTYQSFINQGYSVPNALTHTREFVTALLTSLMNNNNKNEDKEN